uniref:TNF receptor-associated factor n=1 Tax=Chelonoidis abingdonii TaxID=106734 RepID=A0A8C0G245_CHEAB
LRADRVSPDGPGSSPDENEFPFGYPTTQQTLCGHRYCAACLSWVVRNNKNPICQKCNAEDPGTVNEGSLLTEERVCNHVCINVSQKTKEHEKSAVGTHLMMLLQHIKQLRTSLCPVGGTANGIIPHLATAESKVKGLERKVSDLQLQGALEISGDLEVDCFPGSSVCEEESILQQLVREKVISELENKLHVFENIVAVLNKEVETSNLEIAAFRRKSGLDQDVIQSLELKLHRCLTQKDAGLSKLHKRLQSFEQASYDGVFLWKITDVNRKYHESVTGRVVSLFSPAFYTAKYGYKVCLRIYLNGDGTGKGTHVSLFFVVMKGEYDALLPWPFKHKVTFMMLDQNNREHVIDAFRPDLTSASFQRPVSDMNVASGCPMFLPLCKLQSPKYAYVREDTLFLKCIIETNS